MSDQIDLGKVMQRINAGDSKLEIATDLNVCLTTLRVFLRRKGIEKQRKETEAIKTVVEAHSLGLSHRKTAKQIEYSPSFVGLIWRERNLQPHGIRGRLSLDDQEKSKRTSLLERIGLNDSIFEKFGVNETLTGVSVMEESIDFFSDLGANVQKVYEEYPQLLAHGIDDLDSKLEFLEKTIGIPARKISKLPELFTYNLKSMKNKYQHYIDFFEGNEELARSLLRYAATVFGNNTSLIDHKIMRYRIAGINFHRNYILLQKDPDRVIDTRDYLNELGIERDEKGMWYYILLAIDRRTLEPKVKYCENEGINWRNGPRVLILGLGKRDKNTGEFILGALDRRVEMIKKAFEGRQIPKQLDYMNNPEVIACYTDDKIQRKIEKYG